MLLEAYEDAPAFERAAADWLKADEIRNSLCLSILQTAIRAKGDARGWVISDSGGPRAVLLQTVPGLLCLAGSDRDAAIWAADNARVRFQNVFGAAKTVEPFARRWSEVHRVKRSLQTAMTFYVLTKLEAFRDPGGALRTADQNEAEEIIRLSLEAAREMCLPEAEQTLEFHSKAVPRLIAERRQFVWMERGRIVAIARYAPTLPDAGARIGMVYTLPGSRGRGYGAAITGAITRMLLESGQRWVSLFADDANPTSNGVYRRLGYVPHHAAQSWRIG